MSRHSTARGAAWSLRVDSVGPAHRTRSASSAPTASHAVAGPSAVVFPHGTREFRRLELPPH